MILDHVESYKDMIELTLNGWQSKNPRIFVERVYQEILLDQPGEDEIDGSLTIVIMIENDTNLTDDELVGKWITGVGKKELIKELVKAGIPADATNGMFFDVLEQGPSGSDMVVRFEAPEVAEYVRMMFQQSPITDVHLMAGRRIRNAMDIRTDDKTEIMRKLLSSIRQSGSVMYKHLLAAEYLYATNKWPELATIIRSWKNQ